MYKILIVDDDTAINDLLYEVLTDEGYSVTRAFSGSEALLSLASSKPDLILLDLMLPGIAGEQLIPQIKDIPVIAVSAKADTSNKEDVLLSGACDYITKPFDIQELLARVQVQLRRNSMPVNDSILIYKKISLHTDTHTVTAGDEEVKLTRTEFAILKLLMQNPGKVCSKLGILDRISFDTPDCTEDSLKIHIHNLRRKLKKAAGCDYISSVWGIGFMLGEE